MPGILRPNGDTTSAHSTFTGKVRQVTIDTTRMVPVVHDGATQGGFPAIHAVQDAESNRPAAGIPGRVFIATDTGVMYRDSGSGWTQIGGGDVSATNVSYDNSGSGLSATDVKAALDEMDSGLVAHTGSTSNPHSVTASQVGAPPDTRQVAAGAGLTGGGDLTSDITLAVDVLGLTEDTSPDGTADYVLTHDGSAGDHKRVLLDNLPGGATSLGDLNDTAYIDSANDGEFLAYSSMYGWQPQGGSTPSLGDLTNVSSYATDGTNYGYMEILTHDGYGSWNVKTVSNPPSAGQVLASDGSGGYYWK